MHEQREEHRRDHRRGVDVRVEEDERQWEEHRHEGAHVGDELHTCKPAQHTGRAGGAEPGGGAALTLSQKARTPKTSHKSTCRRERMRPVETPISIESSTLPLMNERICASTCVRSEEARVRRPVAPPKA